ncbi:MAG: protein kinase [Blautia sp.]|uniref:serine/threonine-protein kinase n=2 Tax=Blautia sp. TaxID=1955243 RepID=UPI0025B8ED44|nr:serine/threonine-protein kinase [Blautia sp.]MCI7448754.1 protein kinase [Blautia sp.]MDY4115803.1 protein kinase [Blautia sp.]
MQKYIANTYEVIAQIGMGNSGIVYKARHRNLDKFVVLKKIKANAINIADNRAEADVLKNLKHAYLPQVMDFVEDNGDIYTVMEFISGNSFKQYLDAGTAFPEKSEIIWMKQVAATLCYLHNQKPPIIHSDLKPGNIMLTNSGNVCLIDFNISFSLGGNGFVNGYTKNYASPEQIRAWKYNQTQPNPSLRKKIDKRSDIYSMGATFYHIVTGSKPMPDDNGYVQDIREKKPEMNQLFGAVIMKCLEPDLKKRYQRAEDVLYDLQTMAQRSKEYRSLLRKQKIISGVLAGGMILFAGLALAGYFRIDSEKMARYEDNVAQEEKCIKNGDYDQLDEYYQQAVKLYPGKMDAYLQKALALNRQKEYEDCINFINTNILNSKSVMNDGSEDSVYYLLGDCYSQLEDYEQAAEYYNSAIEANPENGNYYRDGAIMEAYCGNTDKAQELMETAKEKGLDTTEVNYVDGEIKYSKGDYEDARSIFQKCIEDSDDAYIQMRSYIMEAKCIDKQDDSVDGKKRKMKLLKKAKKELPKENNIGILEELAQTYSDLGNDTGDIDYYQKALSVFEQIQSQGMGNYSTGYNISVLYQNMGDYDSAERELMQLLDNYGEDYKTYKSLAFLEGYRQEQLTKEQRDYSKFKEYYEKAYDLYQSQLSSNANDMEMDRLEEQYNQAVSNGWIF